MLTTLNPGPRRRAILHLVWDRELSAGEIAAHFDISVAGHFPRT
jgi:hypothetical protein